MNEPPLVCLALVGATLLCAVAAWATTTGAASEVTINAAAGTSAVEDINDDANGVGEPESDILPGHALTWKHGFDVPVDANDLTVTIGTVAADRHATVFRVTRQAPPGRRYVDATGQVMTPVEHVVPVATIRHGILRPTTC